MEGRFTQVIDPDYEPSETSANTSPIDPPDDLREYSTLDTNTSGLGGEAAITADSGVGIFAADCTANDTDGDAICDLWETGGIPFWAQGVRSIPIPLASVGTKDLFVELDVMEGHELDARLLL